MATARKKTGKRVKDGRVPSQQMPQLARVTLGKDEAWMLDAIALYQAAFEADHGVALTTARIVVKAIDDVLGGVTPTAAYRTKSPGMETQIGPFRMTERYKRLPKAVTAEAKRAGVIEADVIRGALAHWLIEHGFGEKAKRKKDVR